MAVVEGFPQTLENLMTWVGFHFMLIGPDPTSNCRDSSFQRQLKEKKQNVWIPIFILKDSFNVISYFQS